VTTVIVFSKNRAAQLDLLLRSLQKNATHLYDSVHVIWKGEREYAAAYRTCELQHLEFPFHAERDLRGQTLWLAQQDEHVAFLMDDCVFYRKVEGRDPAEILCEDEDVLCFSPRLGLNTTECYPLRCSQALPATHSAEDGVLYWEWGQAECDFSYPASLDGHVFRTVDLLPLLQDVFDWSDPNTVEAKLARDFQWNDLDRPMMAAHAQSSLVGIPVNRVGSSHESNRFGEMHAHDVATLNHGYLGGNRLALDIDPDAVNAAHVEFSLRFA
jgi:hypothetical protein